MILAKFQMDMHVPQKEEEKEKNPFHYMENQMSKILIHTKFR
jgi:hypothetical protein